MSAFHDNALMGASGQQGYKISRSVRLRSSASAYLNRTPASAGNRKTWTWSGWVKRGTLGSAQVLMSSDVGTSNTTWIEFGFDAADTFTITAYATDSNTTSAVFRDPSAWYHIVVAFDSTQATAANRCKIYVNSTQQTLTGAGFTLNADYGINNSQIHAIGQRNWASGVGRYFDGYLTEVNFIDGQALTPSSFGETDSITGVWKPKKYAGTYGTNGFYLNFSDNSGATATTIGKDNSGNGNNWTPNNISVTAGVTYDSMIDVPTLYADGGNGRGNYCVLSPIDTQSGVLSDGNMTVTTSASNYSPTRGTIAVSSGKWYWEVVIGSGTSTQIGICPTSEALTTAIGSTAGSYAYYNATGQKVNNNSYSTYGATYTTGDVIGHALDLDSGTLTFYKNNTSQGTAFTGLSGVFAPAVSDASTAGTNTITANFGQRPFTYTPPTGFVALNTQNLPAPTISNGAQYMAATTYTGNGTARSIANTVNGVSMQPDFVWIKDRSIVRNHRLVDSVRGVGLELYSDLTNAQATDAIGLTAFNSDGFSLGTSAGYNQSGNSLIAWQWKGGGTAVSNTAGTITSSVSANPTAGFSVVTYTGTGTTGATVGHGLGAVPQMIIVKNRSAAAHWPVGHVGLTSWGYNLYLSLTNAQAAVNTSFNSTTPTSTVFTLGPSGGETNFSGQNFVAYCFSEVAGYSKFGSYTGNGSADGPFVYCGFRPRFVMVKRTDTAGYDWELMDTARDVYNAAANYLYPNSSAAEFNGPSNTRDFLSNGFKIRHAGAGANASGGTYIFAAFAEVPFKSALGR